MNQAFRRSRRDTLEGILWSAQELAKRGVEDGEDLEDVVEQLQVLRELVEGKDAP